jgi:hypothetical protein
MLKLVNSVEEPDISAVTSLFNNYHAKKSKRFGNVGGGLFRGADGSITVTLPTELCWDWSNSAGGNSGGKNPRPVGIRLLPNRVKELYGDNDNALETIFSSIDSLKAFIMTSDRQGRAKLENLLAKKKLKSAITEVDIDLDIKDIASKSEESLDNIGMKLLDLAIRKDDNELAKLVLNGALEKIAS